MSDGCRVCDGKCSNDCVVVDAFGWRLHYLRLSGVVRLMVHNPDGKKVEVAQNYNQDMAGQGGACSADAATKVVAGMGGFSCVPYAILVALAGLIALGSVEAEEGTNGIGE